MISPVPNSTIVEQSLEIISTRESPESRKTARTSQPAQDGSLFRVIWRWHFYAGIILAPVIIIMSLTGAVYIFKSDILNFAKRDLVYVTPGTTTVSLQSQIDAAISANPGATATFVRVPAVPNQSTVISMRPPTDPNVSSPEEIKERPRGPQKTLSVYVNPYDGKVIGQTGSDFLLDSTFAAILKIHRNLWAGTTGRILTELGTSWCVILIVSGVYLWWPQKKSQIAGVWTFRWKAKLYTVLRDLHSVGGFYVFPICLLIVLTGMFYTIAVGKVVHDSAHAWMGDDEHAPVKQFSASSRSHQRDEQKSPRNGSESATRPEQTSQTELAQVGKPIDELMQIARDKFPDRILSTSLSGRGRGPDHLITVKASNDIYNTYGRMKLTDITMHRETGAIVEIKDNMQTAHFWHAWTLPLHMGSVMGMTSKILWLVACIALVLMPITGIWMWWERRPRGRTGIPSRPIAKLPLWLKVTVVLSCILFPILGLSVVLILAGEWMYHRANCPA